MDMSDILGIGFGGFEVILTGGHGGHSAAHMGIRLSITLEEAAAGVTKDYSYAPGPSA